MILRLLHIINDGKPLRNILSNSDPSKVKECEVKKGKQNTESDSSVDLLKGVIMQIDSGEGLEDAQAYHDNFSKDVGVFLEKNVEGNGNDDCHVGTGHSVGLFAWKGRSVA